jgi:hypothetical protein
VATLNNLLPLRLVVSTSRQIDNIANSQRAFRFLTTLAMLVMARTTARLGFCGFERQILLYAEKFAQNFERVFNSFVMESQLITCATCSTKNLNSRVNCLQCDGTLKALSDSEAERTPDTEAEEAPSCLPWMSLTLQFMDNSWSRLAKLIYTLCYISAVGYLLFGSFSQGQRHPTITYNIKCLDHTDSYNAEHILTIDDSNGRFPGNFDQRLRDFCATHSGVRPHIGKINYTTSNHEYRFSYEKAGVFLGWGLLVTILLGELLRRSFSYVVAGVPFFEDFKTVKTFVVKLSDRSKSLFWDGKPR